MKIAVKLLKIIRNQLILPSEEVADILPAEAPELDLDLSPSLPNFSMVEKEDSVNEVRKNVTLFLY